MIEGTPLDKMWGRNVRIEFGKRGSELRQLTGIGVSFTVEKNSEQKHSNSATINIFNLTTYSREILADTKQAIIGLYVGYGDKFELLYAGDIIKSNSIKESTSWKTTVECGEGYLTLSSSRVNLSFDAGTPVKKVIQSLSESLLYVNKGFIDELPNDKLKRHYIASGMAKDELTRLLSLYGYELSISNGTYNIYNKKSKVNPSQVLLITSQSGLIGSPQRSSVQTKEEKKAINKILSKEEKRDYHAPINGVSFKTLLIPQLRPQQIIRLESNFCTGYYKIRKVEFVGTNRGQDWYSNVDAVLVQQ